eukprot:6777166-Pyramimonas_sp.AAC.1
MLLIGVHVTNGHLRPWMGAMLPTTTKLQRRRQTGTTFWWTTPECPYQKNYVRAAVASDGVPTNDASLRNSPAHQERDSKATGDIPAQ